MSKDKQSGYGITKENDLISVFSKNNQGRKTITSAKRRGAQTLDCIDGKLTKFYRSKGFKEYDRIPWDDKYAPNNWNYKEFGRPDIVFMKLRKKKKK